MAAAAVSNSSFSLNAQAASLLTGLLKTALGNQAAGATSAATAIGNRSTSLAQNWTNR